MDDQQIHWLLKALREAAGEIEEYLYAIDREDAIRRPEADEPNLIELAAQLRDNEEQVLGWLEIITSARRRDPPLPYVNVDLLPLERDYSRLEVRKVLREFTASRRRTVHLLWSLDNRDWRRQGIHPYRGPISVQEIVQELNWHDLRNLWEVRRRLEQLGRVHADT
jgi:hypothetical protein